MPPPSSNDDGTISEDDLQPALSDDDDTQDTNTSDESEVEGGAPKRTKNAWVTLMSVDLLTELHTLIPGLADDELLVELGEATDAIKVSHVFSKVMMATLTSLSHVQKRAAAAFEEKCAGNDWPLLRKVVLVDPNFGRSSGLPTTLSGSRGATPW